MSRNHKNAVWRTLVFNISETLGVPQPLQSMRVADARGANPVRWQAQSSKLLNVLRVVGRFDFDWFPPDPPESWVTLSGARTSRIFPGRLTVGQRPLEP